MPLPSMDNVNNQDRLARIIIPCANYREAVVLFVRLTSV